MLKFEVSIPEEQFALLVQRRLISTFGEVQVRMVADDAVVANQAAVAQVIIEDAVVEKEVVKRPVAIEATEYQQEIVEGGAPRLPTAVWDGKRRLTFFRCGTCGAINIRWADGNSYSAEDCGFIFDCNKCNAAYLFELEELLPVYYTCGCCGFGSKCFMPKDYALDFLKCKECDAPIDLFYNEKKQCFSSGSKGGEANA